MLIEHRDDCCYIWKIQVLTIPMLYLDVDIEDKDF